MDYRVLDIFLPDAGGYLVPAYVEGYDPGLAMRFRVRLGEGMVGAAAAGREPVFVPDAGLLATLHDIGKETASILDLDELLQRLADIVKRVVDYEMFGILLLDEERDELVLRKAVNFGPGRERTRLPATEGLCGAAVRSREPVLVGDVRTDPRYVSLVPETRSELVVPLLHKDKVVGLRARWRSRWRTPASSPRSARTRRASPASSGSPRRSSTLSSPRATLRRRMGSLGPLPPRPRARRGSLRFLRHGRRPARRRDRRRRRQGRPRGALRGVRLRDRPLTGLRAAVSRGPDATGEPHAPPERHRRPLLHPGLRPLRLPRPDPQPGQLGLAAPGDTTRPPPDAPCRSRPPACRSGHSTG